MECYGCIFHRQTRAIVLHYSCMMGLDTSPVSRDNGFIQNHGGVSYLFIHRGNGQQIVLYHTIMSNE